jgi:hypothetical protein
MGPTLTTVEANEAESSGVLCRRGNLSFDLATPPDLRALRAAVAPVYASLARDPATRATLDAIARAKRELAQPPASLERCTMPPVAAARTRTALDGTWVMDTARSSAGPDFLDENWGHWIFVFDRGRFAITQENATSCTWGYGTFSVDGDKTTWRFSDGGGQAPNNAENKPGEQFSYRLSVFRDTATLSAVKGAISPENFDPEPWRRLGPPSRASFSRRCPPPEQALPR